MILGRVTHLARVARCLVFVAVGIFGVGCHLCEYREERGTGSITVAQDTPCPSPEDAKSQMGPSVLKLLGPAVAKHINGSQECCYDVDVRQEALDLTKKVAYRANKRCDTVQECGCVAASDLLARPAEKQALWYVPEDATILEVISGPTYSYYAQCGYEVRLKRKEQVVSKNRCTLVSFARGPETTCPPPAELTGGAGTPLHEVNEKEIVETVRSAPTVKNIRLPLEQCDYPATVKHSSDVCG